jgi:hypothetical protein
MKSLKQVISILKGNIQSTRVIHDVAALIQLRPLLKSYIPLSSMAMNPSEIARICNDVIINQRKRIVEFGSGVSTVYIAKLMPDDSVLYTIDHNKEWLDIVATWLVNEGLRDRVVMVHAPLKEVQISSHKAPWYDCAIVESCLPSDSIDCLIVDGPPAGASGTAAKARYPAIPLLKSRLAQDCSVYLDDAVRNSEREIAKEWGEELGVNFELRLENGGYAVAKCGKGFMD